MRQSAVKPSDPMSRTAVLLALLFVCAVVLVWVASSAKPQAVSRDLAAELAAVPLPAGATVVHEDAGGRYGLAWASRNFALDSSTEDIVAYYRAELSTEGWTPGHESKSVYDVVSVCFRKGDVDASLEVHPTASPEGRYFLTLDWEELLPFVSQLNGMQMSSILTQVRDLTVRPRRSA